MTLDHLDVVHFPANYGFGPKNTRVVITLHDEINIMPWLEIVGGHPKNARTLALMTYLHILSMAACKTSSFDYDRFELFSRPDRSIWTVNPEKIVPIPMRLPPI